MQIQLSPRVRRKTVAGRFFLFLWCGQVVFSAMQISHFSHCLARFNADVTKRIRLPLLWVRPLHVHSRRRVGRGQVDSRDVDK